MIEIRRNAKVLLGNHAHGDHQEGDALVKQRTGAQVMAMAEDGPALQELVTLGGTTLVAHLTPHTRGCTTWSAKIREGEKTYEVVFGCSLRPLGTLTPAIVDEFNRSFKLVRSLPCEVPLGDHPAQYPMREKYAKLSNKDSNPFIDPAGCFTEADIEEAMFHALMDEQRIAK